MAADIRKAPRKTGRPMNYTTTIPAAQTVGECFEEQLVAYRQDAAGRHGGTGQGG